MALNLMNVVHVALFGGALLSGSFGLFMIVAFVWLPIAASWKMEVDICRPVRSATRSNQSNVVVDGVRVKVTPVPDSTGEMAVGMSMGEA